MTNYKRMPNDRFTLIKRNHFIRMFDNETKEVLSKVDAVTLLNNYNDTINRLNRMSQYDKDCVNNWFIENWDKLTDEQKQSAHLELGIDIDYND